MTLDLLHPLAHAANDPEGLDDAGLDALVALEEWRPASTEAAITGLFTHPDAPVQPVTVATQSTRVRRTALQRWGVADNRVEEPTTLEALVALVTRARVTGRKLRVVGSARSLSRAPEPDADALLVSLASLGAPLDVDAATLRDGVDATALYRAQAGRVLADALGDLQARGQALASMGSGCFQTLMGAISTSTHGSGIRFPALPGAVRSLDAVVCLPNGEVVIQRIEPRDGPTSPTRFATAQARAATPMQLVQDDDTFNAFLVSLGCLGLVYAVTLAVVPAYWLRETRTQAWWTDVRATLAAELAGADFVEVLVSPWASARPDTGTTDHLCLVTRRIRVHNPADQRVQGGRPIAMAIAQTPLGRLGAEIATCWATR